MNLDLKNIVNQFVETKIKDIKFVDEIFKMSIFSIDKPNYVDNFERLYRLKKILQLTINVYNDFETYGAFNFKFTGQKTDRIDPLNYFYRYDENTDMWVCTGQPRKEWVTEALFNYIICLKSIELAEENLANFEDNKIPIIDHCVFCESYIRSDSDVCDTCEASISDVMNYSRKMNSFQNEENKRSDNRKSEDVSSEENRDCNVISRSYDLGKRNCDQQTEIERNKCIAREENYRECFKCKDVYFMTLDERCNHSETWMCRDCTRLEEGDDLGWTDLVNEDVRCCDGCGAQISGGDGECDNCRGEVEAQRGPGVSGDNAQWKCRSCNILYPYSETVCGQCNIDRKEVGLWLCVSCTYGNKFVDARCDVCFTENRHVVSKFCQICKQAKIGDSEDFCGKCSMDSNSKIDKGWWQCGFVDCGAWTEGREDYCIKCGIWKYGFECHNRGDPVKRMKNGKITAVWICVSCHRLNNIDSIACGWFCRTKRYEKKICNKCQKCSDGTSNYCKKCKKCL